MKIIVCRVGEAPVIEDVGNVWAYAKSLCADDRDEDPMIQVTPLENGLEVYSDEDALGKDLPFNRGVPTRAKPIPPGFTIDDVINYEPGMCRPGQQGFHNLHGNFLLARFDFPKERAATLTEDDIAHWMFTLGTS